MLEPARGSTGAIARGETPPTPRLTRCSRGEFQKMASLASLHCADALHLACRNARTFRAAQSLPCKQLRSRAPRRGVPVSRSPRTAEAVHQQPAPKGCETENCFLKWKVSTSDVPPAPLPTQQFCVSPPLFRRLKQRSRLAGIGAPSSPSGSNHSAATEEPAQSVTLPPTSPHAIVWCGDTPVL